ncbi:MAG: hypothetical protein HOP17_05940 [Acidobacteria bacterium]|nr:hypothetical protein [Acidobacteriota bacterium]
MNHFSVLVLFTIVLAVSVTAQLPPHPVPVVETDIRENTIRMRSVELERVKREADKPLTTGSTEVSEARFAQIKADFENIQKKQDSIIRVYATPGVKTDNSRIQDSAKAIRKSALRLNANLFGGETGKPEKVVGPAANKRNSLKDLIIALDRAIEIFVHNEIFQNVKIVETKFSEKARLTLQEIVRLSGAVSAESKRIKELQ